MLLGHAVGAALDYASRAQDIHLRPNGVVGLGLMFGLAAFIALIVFISTWLRGSSRGHRVIVESALVLALGLPVSAAALVADTNRAFDRAPPVHVSRKVSSCERRQHRSAKRRKHYSYHLW